jgi:branched-chain amino acid transport system substrate-binding protein
MSYRKSALAIWVSGLIAALMMFPLSSNAQPIKIGAMFVASGPMGGYGKHGGQAIQMAVDEINADGGILGRKVAAMVGDTKLNKDVALDLAKKFITQDTRSISSWGPRRAGLRRP